VKDETPGILGSASPRVREPYRLAPRIDYGARRFDRATNVLKLTNSVHSYVLRKGKRMLRNTEVIGESAADSLAVQGLSFLIEEPERLDRFLALTGLSPETIREVAREPAFLAAVLDHIAQDQSLLTAFAENSGVQPVAVDKARRALGGGEWERETA
jgi:hypothetical protein